MAERQGRQRAAEDDCQDVSSKVLVRFGLDDWYWLGLGVAWLGYWMDRVCIIIMLILSLCR